MLFSILLAAVLAGGGVAIWLICSPEAELESGRILAAYREDAEYGGLALSYPLDGTLFPPEIIPPTFQWEDRTAHADAWLVTIPLADRRERMNFLTSAEEWTPPDDAWETIKRHSLPKEAASA